MPSWLKLFCFAPTTQDNLLAQNGEDDMAATDQSLKTMAQELMNSGS